MTQPKTTTIALRTKTTLQEEREARDLAIYNEYNKLAANPDQSKVALNEYIMQKYGIHSTGTLYLIRKKVAERIHNKHQNTAK